MPKPRARNPVHCISVSTWISERQDNALTALAFRSGVSKSILVRMAILAMIDYEADHLAEVATAKLRHAAE